MKISDIMSIVNREARRVKHEAKRGFRKITGKNKPQKVTVTEHKLTADEIKDLGLPKKDEVEALLKNGYVSEDEYKNLRSSHEYMYGS